MSVECARQGSGVHRSLDGCLCVCLAELVAEHVALADALARRFHHRGECLEDLKQVACVGLVLAAQRFDASRGVPFGGFATPTIIGELRRHMRDHAWGVRPPRNLQELRPQVNATIDMLTQRRHRIPRVADVAEELSLPVEVVAEVMALDSAYRPDSLDGGGAERGAPAEVLSAPRTRLDEVEGRVSLEPSLAALPEPHRDVLRLHYLDELSQRRIAAVVGVSQMQVSRLLRKSLDLVRQDFTLKQNEA